MIIQRLRIVKNILLFSRKEILCAHRFIKNRGNNAPCVDDQSPLDLEAEHGVTVVDIYDGQVPEWI